jgi:hypothetical protein
MKNSRLLWVGGGIMMMALAHFIYQHYYFPSLSSLTPCADLTQACAVLPTSYQVYTDHPPKRLAPFLLTLTGKAQQVHVSFSMPDMDMGPNQYTLIPNPAHTRWQGKIILPICSTGRRDWQMTVYIDHRPIGQVAFQTQQ